MYAIPFFINMSLLLFFRSSLAKECQFRRSTSSSGTIVLIRRRQNLLPLSDKPSCTTGTLYFLVSKPSYIHRRVWWERGSDHRSVGDKGFIRVPASSENLPPPVKAYVKNGKAIPERYGIAVYHQLHCLASRAPFLSLAPECDH